ncbi:hypothetical protein [Paractinoplanes durhamensis]|uniref:hypothetical protein n=1 Tax=Paractinoplanes durhamensis TaxID=113563 RepID=UPI00362F411A
MDQREWDYGARMPRDRRAAQPWPAQSPERTDISDPEPKWASLTDTGSMEPSAEALAWQRRADAWAQQTESDQSQAVEPTGRWSDVAKGRPAFPADGVGWRSETAEWRAAGARWRQTTEWRSTTGSHGWRSTTEAWQTGGESSYQPPVETPAAQPAISNTPWSAPEEAEPRPAWQQFTSPTTDNSWQQTPSRQQPAPRPPAESSPPGSSSSIRNPSSRPGTAVVASPGSGTRSRAPRPGMIRPTTAPRRPALRPTRSPSPTGCGWMIRSPRNRAGRPHATTDATWCARTTAPPGGETRIRVPGHRRSGAAGPRGWFRPFRGYGLGHALRFRQLGRSHRHGQHPAVRRPGVHHHAALVHRHSHRHRPA